MLIFLIPTPLKLFYWFINYIKTTLNADLLHVCDVASLSLFLTLV